VNLKLSSRYVLGIESCEVLLLISMFLELQIQLLNTERKCKEYASKWRLEIFLEASVQTEEWWQV